MKLTVRLPVLVAAIYGKHHNRIAHVDGEIDLLTTVHAIFRVEGKDGLSETLIRADAFIPEHHRGEVSPHVRWLDDEILPVNVLVADNKKTLAAFMASRDLSWTFNHEKS